VVERTSWPVPPVFGLIQKIGGVAQPEMDGTFNMGLGMILVVGNGIWRASGTGIGGCRRLLPGDTCFAAY
jgi:hypothetical protein